MHILLSVLWGGLGIFLIAYHSLTDAPLGRIHFLPGSPSGGWLALILAAYNLLHWYARESMRKERQRLQMAEAERRERLYRERSADRERPVDPNFRFTEEEPPAGA
jgi:hypothetical protein